MGIETFQEELMKVSEVTIMGNETQENACQVDFEERLKEVEGFRKSQEEIFKDIDKQGTECLANLKSMADEVGVLLSKGLSSGFSKIYGLKVRRSQGSARLHNFFFVLVVLIALVFSGFNCYAIRIDVSDFSSLLSKAGVVFLSSFPVYAFLIWLAYIARKNSLLSRRVQESYSHKMLFSAAVSGLIKQISTVRAINEQKSAELLSQMTSALIRTLESDASLHVDIKKYELPVNEVTDGIAKVINSISDLIPVKDQYKGIDK